MDAKGTTFDNIVIVGAGMAGAKTAVALRDLGHRGSLTIVGDEDRAPYERPPLSKSYLLGETSAEDALVVPTAWYEENDVALWQGISVENIDRETRTLHCSDGRELSYDALVLATGSRARRLNISGANTALTLRTFPDADELRQALDAASSIVIIGAGWIGLEVAAAARTAGLDVVVLEAAPAPLQAVLGDQIAGHFADLHRGRGVDLRTGSSVRSISGTGPYTVATTDGEIVTDLVVMGVGAIPNDSLAQGAGLRVDHGIVVDDHFRTEDQRIFAIGDVARAHHTTLGSAVRIEHWDNALRQGEAVAKILMGSEVEYDWQPYFFTDQFDLGMEYVGLANGTDDVVVRGDPSTGEFIAFWVREGNLAAAMNVNIWDVNDDLQALIGRPVEVAKLTDPAVPLTDVVVRDRQNPAGQI